MALVDKRELAEIVVSEKKKALCASPLPIRPFFLSLTACLGPLSVIDIHLRDKQNGQLAFARPETQMI